MAIATQLTANMALSALTRTVITGPAGSGKSTLAQALAHRFTQADLWPAPVVIDYDLIAVALGSPDGHDHPDHHRRIAKAAWIGAVRHISALPPSVPVILIHAEPTQARRSWYAVTGWHLADTDTPPV